MTATAIQFECATKVYQKRQIVLEDVSFEAP
ncbi:MAG: hypothetical protein M2R45_03528 [Verrucomicrobia subdivision 3 bacterium]|nr:hypothetical protein [Limisphaerales bacterium]MCS1415925.1 hypothetical protein [Limisphaerales bacterium]